jgi:hypothetical protein
MRRLTTTAALTVVAIVATACGGGNDRVSAAEWVDRVCAAFADWGREAVPVVERLQTLDAPSDLDALGDLLATVRDAVVALNRSTTDFAADVRAAGVPDVDDGEVFSRRFAGQLDRAAALIDDAEGALDRLDASASSLSDFEAATEALEKVSQGLDQVGTRLEALDAPGLDEAFVGSDECRNAQRAFS